MDFVLRYTPEAIMFVCVGIIGLLVYSPIINNGINNPNQPDKYKSENKYLYPLFMIFILMIYIGYFYYVNQKFNWKHLAL